MGGGEVCVVEGEKDADTLIDQLGIPATTNCGGADKWRSEYATLFRKKKVVIIRDNDEAGEAHANRVARELKDEAELIKVICPSKLPKGDVTDWVQQESGTVDALMDMIGKASNLDLTNLEPINLLVESSKTANRYPLRNFTIEKKQVGRETKAVKVVRNLNNIIQETQRRFLGFPWPSRRWTTARLTPPSTMWVAKLWRRIWMPPSLVITEASRNPKLITQLVQEYGDEALEVAAKHPGVGSKVISEFGEAGVKAGKVLSTDDLIILSRQKKAFSNLPAQEKADFLEVLKNNPKVVLTYLAGTAGIVLTADAVRDMKLVAIGTPEKPGILMLPFKRWSWIVPGFVALMLLGVFAIIAGYIAPNVWGKYKRERIKTEVAQAKANESLVPDTKHKEDGRS